MSQSADEEGIREYCLYHELQRPHIPWKKMAFYVLMFECVTILLLCWLSLQTGLSILLFEATHLCALLLFGGQALRLAVMTYQRYAPEYVRRRCQCMPSCSEYALIALDKYCWPKALLLIYWRLAHTCRQPGYKIDFP